MAMKHPADPFSPPGDSPFSSIKSDIVPASPWPFPCTPISHALASVSHTYCCSFFALVHTCSIVVCLAIVTVIHDSVTLLPIGVENVGGNVTEENLATLFINCGQVVECRMCGDPNSVLRFAFIEFTDEEGARAALNLSGTVLGYYPINVLPSKTALHQSTKHSYPGTIYYTNIDKKVTQADLKLFFESICGELKVCRNGTIKIDLETNKIMDFIKFDVGNAVMVTGGRNTVRVGVIKNMEKHKGSFETIHVLLGAFCYV
ncbi:Polyadenylate-binding protein-interacting protein 10 [Zea mays]|uniref:Polyadenylate-binding protein-interacting protein 10 n=1 Tax=Zea mays TaxID=4577 RepID=A0A3L6FDF5_MAIZE|nr:Polyadenylate-binding protein-interacting protein 10 [Zea mays]